MTNKDEAKIKTFDKQSNFGKRSKTIHIKRFGLIKTGGNTRIISRTIFKNETGVNALSVFGLPKTGNLFRIVLASFLMGGYMFLTLLKSLISLITRNERKDNKIFISALNLTRKIKWKKYYLM